MDVQRRYKMTQAFLLIVLTGLCLSCHSTPPIGEEIQKNALVDGVYTGSYTGGPNSAEVQVTIQNQNITDITILKHDAWKGKKAESVIPQRIIEQQSTQVDAVTGATNSSYVIMNAVQRAVEQSYAANKTP